MLPPGVRTENNKWVFPDIWKNKYINVYDKKRDSERSIYYINTDIRDHIQILYPVKMGSYEPSDVISDEHIIWFLEYAMTLSPEIDPYHMFMLAFERSLDGCVHVSIAKNKLSSHTISTILNVPESHLYELIMNGWFSSQEELILGSDFHRVVPHKLIKKIKQERHLRIEKTKEILSTVIVPDLANIVLLYHIL
jgi:hypothetical protein